MGEGGGRGKDRRGGVGRGEGRSDKCSWLSIAYMMYSYGSWFISSLSPHR